MMNLEQVLWLAWVGIGAVAGWLASMMMKTKYPQAVLFDILVGSIGALLPAALFKQLWAMEETTSLNLWSLVIAMLGAVVVLALMRWITGRQVFPDESQDNYEASTVN